MIEHAILSHVLFATQKQTQLTQTELRVDHGFYFSRDCQISIQCRECPEIAICVPVLDWIVNHGVGSRSAHHFSSHGDWDFKQNKMRLRTKVNSIPKLSETING